MILENALAKKDDQFETNMNKLEQIVQALEKGELPLEESLKQYEVGIELYKNCKSFLQSAQKRIKLLTDDLKEEEFDDNSA